MDKVAHYFIASRIYDHMKYKQRVLWKNRHDPVQLDVSEEPNVKAIALDDLMGVFSIQGILMGVSIVIFVFEASLLMAAKPNAAENTTNDKKSVKQEESTIDNFYLKENYPTFF